MDVDPQHPRGGLVGEPGAEDGAHALLERHVEIPGRQRQQCLDGVDGSPCVALVGTGFSRCSGDHRAEAPLVDPGCGPARGLAEGQRQPVEQQPGHGHDVGPGRPQREGDPGRKVGRHAF